MIESTLLTIGIIVTMLSSIATTIIGVVRAVGDVRKEENVRQAEIAQLPIDRRKAELDLADQIREIAGKMVDDLREDIVELRKDLRERDLQIGQMDERMRVLIRESRQMRSGLEEALELARQVVDERGAGSVIMAKIISALEKGLQTGATHDTVPTPRTQE